MSGNQTIDAHEACELSIITVNYNGLEDTCVLIDTIPFDACPLEVIVVDNASRQDEASIIAARYPQVKTIRSETNLGFAGGNNLGIRAAKGKYLLFINNDTELRGSTLERQSVLAAMIRRLEEHPQTAMVCPKLRFTWADNPIQFTGYTQLSGITVRNQAIGFGESDRGQYQTAHPTPYGHGAAMMVRHEAISQVGLMPECFFLYYEELDWSMMFTRAGYEIWFEPRATVYHKESKSTGQNSPLRTYYITRNRLLLVQRNWRGTKKLLAYSYLLGIVGARDLLKHTIKCQPALASAVFSGITDFLKGKTGKKEF